MTSGVTKAIQTFSAAGDADEKLDGALSGMIDIL
jgi:hypothetical protein